MSLMSLIPTSSHPLHHLLSCLEHAPLNEVAAVACEWITSNGGMASTLTLLLVAAGIPSVFGKRKKGLVVEYALRNAVVFRLTRLLQDKGLIYCLDLYSMRWMMGLCTQHAVQG